MLTLAIETSNPPAPGGGSVALGLVDAGAASLLEREDLRPVGRERDDLLPAIDRVVRAAGKQPADLQAVAVSIGPGGYTSLRMACAAAKMIAFPSDARCWAVPSALSAALSADDRTRARPLAVALAAKRDTAHVTIFQPGFERSPAAPCGAVLTVDGLEAKAGGLGAIIADKHLPATFRDWAARAGVPTVEPVWDAWAVLLAAAALPPVELLSLNPDYGREPEAVTLWRARKKA